MIDVIVSVIVRIAIGVVWRGLQLAAAPLVLITAIGAVVVALRIPAVRADAIAAARDLATTFAIALTITGAVIALGVAIANTVRANEDARRARSTAAARALVRNSRAAAAAADVVDIPGPTAAADDAPAAVAPVDLDTVTAAPDPALAGAGAAVIPFATRPTDRRFAR